MKLLSLIKHILLEGVKIDLKDESDYASTIVDKEGSTTPIEGEQLISIQGIVSNRDTGVDILYSLEGNKVILPPSKRKAVMDVLKYRFDEVEDILRPIIKNVASKLANFDPQIIFYLESKGNASRGIATILAQELGNKSIYPIPKNVFDNAYYLVNWEKLEKDGNSQIFDTVLNTVQRLIGKQENQERISIDVTSKNVLQTVKKVLDSSKGTVVLKTKQEDVDIESIEDFEAITSILPDEETTVEIEYTPKPSYRMSKSTTYPHVRKFFHTKYTVDQDKIYYPSYNDYTNKTNGIKLQIDKDILPILDAFTSNRRILIVDDNIYSGSDFRYLLRDIKKVQDKMIEAKRVEGIQTLKDISTIDSILKIVNNEIKKAKTPEEKRNLADTTYISIAKKADDPESTRKNLINKLTNVNITKDYFRDNMKTIVDMLTKTRDELRKIPIQSGTYAVDNVKGYTLYRIYAEETED